MNDQAAAPVEVAVRCAHSALVSPATLKPHPNNPNQHPPKQIALFIEILKFQGWRRPITISKRSGFITKGHGALLAAQAMGLTEVPIDEQEYPHEAAELADLVADNQLPRMAELDQAKLQEVLVYLSDAPEKLDLKLTGLDQKKLDKLMPAVVHPAPGGSDAPPPAGIAPGSAVIGGDGSGTTPAETGTRLVQLYYTEEGQAEFMRIVEFFQKDLGVESIPDTVMHILRSAYKAHVEDESNEAPE